MYTIGDKMKCAPYEAPEVMNTGITGRKIFMAMEDVPQPWKYCIYLFIYNWIIDWKVI